MHATAAVGGSDGRELGAEARPSFVHRHGADSVPAAAAGDDLRAQARSAAAEAQHKAEEQRRPARRRRHCVRARGAVQIELQAYYNCEGRPAGQQEEEHLLLVAIRQDTTGDDGVIYSGKMAGCVFSSSLAAVQIMECNEPVVVVGPWVVVVVNGLACPVLCRDRGVHYCLIDKLW